MSKILQHRFKLLLFSLLITLSFTTYGQCDLNGFQVVGLDGTCASNGSITVTVPGATTCTSVVAELTLVGTPGVYATQSVSSSGDALFSSLPSGSYTVRMFDGLSYFGPVSTTITSSYSTLTYTNSVVQADCGLSDPNYVANGSVTTTVDAGTGLAPFTYTLTSTQGTVSSGAIAGTSYTFNGVPAGETVGVTVIDACGTSISSSVIMSNNLSPEYTGFSKILLEKVVNGPGNCSFNIGGGTAFSTPNNLRMEDFGSVLVEDVGGLTITGTINVNIGQGVTYVEAQNAEISAGDSIVFYISDGCRDTSYRMKVPDFISNYNYNENTTLNGTCDTVYQVQLSNYSTGLFGDHGQFDMVWMADDNLITVNAFDGVNYVLESQFVNYPFTLRGSGARPNIILSGPGDYEVIADDGCFQDTIYFTIPPFVDDLNFILRQGDYSTVESTSSLFLRALSDFTYPIEVSITPSNGSTVTMFNSVNPSPNSIGDFDGSYSVNWPYTSDVPTYIPGLSFEDIPVDTYDVSITDACLREVQYVYTIDDSLTSYSIDTSVVTGCSGSNVINFDFNIEYRQDVPNSNALTLYYNNAGSLGAIVPGVVFANASLNNNSISNVPSGEYFLGINKQNGTGYSYKSVVDPLMDFNQTRNRKWYIPFNIKPYEAIDFLLTPSYCDISDPNSGFIIVNLDQATGTFPMTYTLYESSDLMTPVGSYTETDNTIFQHVFTGLQAGDYTVVASDGCSSVTNEASIVFGQASFSISMTDSLVCPSSNQTTLSLPIDENNYNIEWLDGSMNVVGTSSTVTVSLSLDETFTVNYSLLPVAGCLNPPVNSDQVTIGFIPDPDLSAMTSDVNICNNTNYSTIISNSQTDYVYELLDENGLSFIPEVVSSGNGGDLALTYPNTFTPTVNTSYAVELSSANVACGGVLTDSVLFYQTTPDLALSVIGETIDCTALTAEISIDNSETGIIYEVLNSDGSSLSPQVIVNGDGSNIVATIPNPGLGTTNYLLEASGTGCLTGLMDTVTIIVVDNIAPVIDNCPIGFTVPADPGMCTASGVNLGVPTVSDNCGIASVTNDAPSIFALGTTTITWTATDNAGNTTICTQDIVVEDTQVPTIVCPSDVDVFADAGVCTASNVYLGVETASDNCGVASVVNDAPSVFQIGTTIVTWTVTDNAGLTANCTQNVTVVDAQPPVIVCPSNITASNDAGFCGVTALNLGTPVTSDNCGVASVVNDAPATFSVGTTTVTWTVTDDAGLTATCIQEVTIEDNETPIINCPIDITVSADAGSCNASNVVLGVPNSDDNCGVASVVNDAPSVFDLGTTIVTWTVTDIHGNSATCEQNVTVEDNEGPIISNCPSNINVSTSLGSCIDGIAVWDVPTASDLCGVVNLTSTHNSGSSFPIGTTTVTYTAEDSNGNQSTCSFTVTVSDEVPPIVICQDITVELSAGGNVNVSASDIDNGSSDNCGIASMTLSETNFSCADVGPNQVTLTVTDLSGNVSSCTAVVTVEDNTAPVLTGCPSDMIVSTSANSCASGVANWIAPFVNDNCNATLTSTHTSGDDFVFGTTTVTYTADDGNGNISTCSFTVTVTDQVAPLVLCQPFTASLDASGTVTISASDIDNGSSDNCGISTMTLDNYTFDCSDIGINPVTLTVTDINGNNSSCTTDVTVVDDEAPIALCQNIEVSLLADGTADIDIADIDNGSSDNCGIALMSLDNMSFDCSNSGSNTVVLTVQDVNGNTETCDATVTIIDNMPPLISNCPSDISLMNAATNCPLEITWDEPTADDNCSIASFTSSHESGTVFPVGTTVVSYLATDINGNTTVCSFDVTVINNPVENPAGVAIANEFACVDQLGDYNLNDLLSDQTSGGTWFSNSSYSLDSIYGIVNLDDADEGSYIATYTVDLGECGYRSVDVNLDLIFCIDCTFPEVITPNGDGLNDAFYIDCFEQYEKVGIQIFNRWGSLVYENDDYQNDWSGTSENQMNINGNQLPEATYYYLITLDDEVEKGYIYVKRN